MSTGPSNELSWPKFEMVSLSSGVGVPDDVARTMENPGVPRDLLNGIYSALPAAELISGNLVKFGIEADGDAKICLDLETSAVVSIPSEQESDNRRRVNSSLGTFAACVKAVIDRFPFYAEIDETDEMYTVFENAAGDLERIINEIDSSACACSAGFWTELIATASMGDLSVNDVLEEC